MAQACHPPLSTQFEMGKGEEGDGGSGGIQPRQQDAEGWVQTQNSQRLSGMQAGEQGSPRRVGGPGGHSRAVT